MVTTDEEEAEPIGAVAALGGRIQEVTREVTSRVTYGEPSLVAPLLLILLTLPVVALSSSVPLMLLGMVSLLGLTVWVVVTVTRGRG